MFLQNQILEYWGQQCSNNSLSKKIKQCRSLLIAVSDIVFILVNNYDEKASFCES